MEWTDGKLEERLERISDGFEQVDRRFDRIEADIGELKAGLAAVQTTLNRISIGLALTFASAFASLLIKGI